MRTTFFCLASLLTCLLASTAMAGTEKTIGWIEHVRIQPENLVLKAKIDTGADNSSVHADNIEVYEKDGKKRVRFTIENKQGESARFDLPLVRIANIKRKGAEPLKRPVVHMSLCIGDTLKNASVNLANRGNFKYRMLIGRSYLKDTFLVNSANQYTAEPACRN